MCACESICEADCARVCQCLCFSLYKDISVIKLCYSYLYNIIVCSKMVKQYHQYEHMYQKKDFRECMLVCLCVCVCVSKSMYIHLRI